MSRGPILIGMASLKGGVGKTTSAVHIAGRFAEQGRNVLLADGDRIRTATTWAARGHLPFTVGSERSLARAAEYDVVIIDSRGGPETVELVELAQACHQLVLPVQADIPSIDGAQQTVNVLREHGVRDEQFVVMLTRVKKQRVGEGREAISSLNMPLLSGKIRQSDAFIDAANEGVLVRDVRGNKLAKSCWQDYIDVTRELEARIGARA